MASLKIKEAMRKKHLWEFRSTSHVYRIDDDVINSVRDVCRKFYYHCNDYLDEDVIEDISWFLSQTERPYRAKCKLTKNF